MQLMEKSQRRTQVGLPPQSQMGVPRQATNSPGRASGVLTFLSHSFFLTALFMFFCLISKGLGLSQTKSVSFSHSSYQNAHFLLFKLLLFLNLSLLNLGCNTFFLVKNRCPASTMNTQNAIAARIVDNMNSSKKYLSTYLSNSHQTVTTLKVRIYFIHFWIPSINTVPGTQKF